MYVYAAVLYVMALSCIEMFERLKTKAESAGAYYTMGPCQQHLHWEISADSVQPSSALPISFLGL